MKRTFQPSKIKRKRGHGFRSRSKRTLKARRNKGRKRLVP